VRATVHEGACGVRPCVRASVRLCVRACAHARVPAASITATESVSLAIYSVR
jgi:hypothetical protein